MFRLNADGTETTEKIANAEIKDGVLKITFIDAAATEDTSVTVRGYVDIEASLASSLYGEEESEQLWIAQTGEDGTQRLVDSYCLPIRRCLTHGIQRIICLVS